MSNAGSTNLPPGVLRLGSGEGRATVLSERPAQILNLPEGVQREAQNARSIIKLRGEVVEQRGERVKVRTERGNVEVKVDRSQRVERGARVEVEIQPQSRNAQTQSAEQPQAQLRITRPPATDLAQPTQPDAPQARAPRPEIYSKPALPAVSEPAQTSTSPAPAHTQGLPPEGEILRLSPLPNTSAATVPPALEPFFTTLPPLTTGYIAPQIEGAALQTLAPAPQLFNQQSPLLTLPQSKNQGAKPLQTALAPQTAGINITAAKDAPAPATPLTNAPTISLPQREGLDVKIDKILPPETPFSAISAPNKTGDGAILQNQNAQSFTGIVTGVTEGRQPRIELFFPQSSSTQHFALQAPTDQPVLLGTRIQFTPQVSSAQGSINEGQAVTTPLPAAPLSTLAAPQSWPLLEDIQHVLRQTAPQAAQVMSNITPNPANPAQLGPAALFFIAAVRGGDIQQWMGEKTLEALQKSGKNLLSSLLQEGQGLSRIADQGGGQDWRSVNIPMQWEGQIQKLALHYKHEHDESAGERGDLKGTRFVFDLALDAMGNVQIDGLYRPVSVDGKRLDLAIRTEQNFSEATRAEMRRVYASALRDSGVTGELSFQGAREGWVTVYIEDDEDVVGVDA